MEICQGNCDFKFRKHPINKFIDILSLFMNIKSNPAVYKSIHKKLDDFIGNLDRSFKE